MKSVEWGEYKIKDLFKEVKIRRKLTKSDLSNDYEFPAYSSESNNSGIIGYSVIPEFICNKQTPIYVIFGDHTRNINLAKKSFSVLDNVKVLLPFTNNEDVLLFIISSWYKEIPNLGYARHWKIAKNCFIKLPTKNNKIDFDFMESFIAELKAERLANLKAYLQASGLDNYELSEQELKALDNIKNVTWGKYKIGNLFRKLKTTKLSYKAKELPTEATGNYILPCLTSSFKNQGLNYYVPEKGATVLNNVITIPQNSDVYRAYYQSANFTVLSDAYAIDWKYNGNKLSREQYLFIVMCINKVTDRPIYSYKNKLGGWNVVKNKYILLPQSNGEIDFDFMDMFISAIQKLVIKDVVIYANKEIKATETIIEQNDD